MHDVDDDRLTIAVPRLQRDRREDVLATSGRLMPLRREPTEPRVTARGSHMGLQRVAAGERDDYESVAIERTETEIVAAAPARSRGLLVALAVLAAASLAAAVWQIVLAVAA